MATSEFANLASNLAVRRFSLQTLTLHTRTCPEKLRGFRVSLKSELSKHLEILLLPPEQPTTTLGATSAWPIAIGEAAERETTRFKETPDSHGPTTLIQISLKTSTSSLESALGATAAAKATA